MLHDLASNNKHSHGVEGSETKDTSLLQCFAGQFSESQLPAVHLRLRGLLLCTLLCMNYRFTSIIVFLFGPDLILVH